MIQTSRHVKYKTYAMRLRTENTSIWTSGRSDTQQAVDLMKEWLTTDER